MTSPYAIRFTRYDRRTGERVQSAPLTVHAESFAAAMQHGAAVLAGLRYGSEMLSQVPGVKDGPRYEYDFARVEATGLGGPWFDNAYDIFAPPPAEEV